MGVNYFGSLFGTILARFVQHVLSLKKSPLAKFFRSECLKKPKPQILKRQFDFQRYQASIAPTEIKYFKVL